MRISNRVFAVMTGVVLGFGVQAAQAQATIKSITADRTQVMLVDGKATIRFTVDGDAPESSNCGMIIDYSGIDTPDNRKINSNDGLLPKVVERVFTRAGAYDVKVRGGRVGGTLACSGRAMVQIIVAGPPTSAAVPAPDAMSASACYRGWRFSQTRADRNSGAFTCKPRKSDMQAPERRIECPSGLAYFETGATYGCTLIVAGPPTSAAVPAPAAMSASACYRGWRFSQTRADRKSGAFTCKPRKSDMRAPERRIECPSGLFYFEKGATYGCTQ